MVQIVRKNTAAGAADTLVLADPMDSSNNRMWSEIRHKEGPAPLLRSLLHISESELRKIVASLEGYDSKFAGFIPVSDATFKEILG